MVGHSRLVRGELGGVKGGCFGSTEHLFIVGWTKGSKGCPPKLFRFRYLQFLSLCDTIHISKDIFEMYSFFAAKLIFGLEEP